MQNRQKELGSSLRARGSKKGWVQSVQTRDKMCTGYPMCNAEEEEEEEDIHFRIKCHVLIWISGFSGLVELINIIVDRWSQLQQIALPAAAAATRPIHTVYISSYRMYTEPHQQWMTPFVNIYTCDTVMSFELDMRFFYLFMLHQLNVANMMCNIKSGAVECVTSLSISFLNKWSKNWDINVALWLCSLLINNYHVYFTYSMPTVTHLLLVYVYLNS